MFNHTFIPSAKIGLHSPSRSGFILIGLVLVCLALVPAAKSAGNKPNPPDGDLGNGNTAEGSGALFSLTIGHDNTAVGINALFNNTTGVDNTATGSSALVTNTTGHDNTATGIDALSSNTTGANNTATGDFALIANTIGNFNVALGYDAGYFLTTGDYNIDIGNVGVTGEANTIRIGTSGNQTATFVAGINTTPVVGTAVVVDGNGQLGTIASSERFKNEIKPMNKASKAIFDLKPVTFRYKHELDPKQLPQFGLVAEEVEKVDPDLVAHDAAGEVYTVRYEAVNAMLLNEFLKEHRRVEELEAAVKQLQSIAKQQKPSRKRTMR
jgi:Chaperone of endosialidase